MSIDARIVGITESPIDNRVKLVLEDRPGGGPAGQQILIISNAPVGWRSSPLVLLLQQDIWGGSSEIMLGNIKLASRDGYQTIHLVNNWYNILKSMVRSER